MFCACPIFGPVPMAKNGTLVVVVSGEEAARQQAAKFMVPSMGRKVIDMGTDVKRAAGLKLLGNSLIVGIIEIISEAYTLADKSGVGAEAVYEFIENFLPAPSFVGYGNKILNNKFDSTIGFAIEGGMKDCSHIRSLAAQHRSPMPVTDIAFQHLLTTRTIGNEKLDWCSLVAAQRVSAGIEPFGKNGKLLTLAEQADSTIGSNKS